MIVDLHIYSCAGVVGEHPTQEHILREKLSQRKAMKFGKLLGIG
jgi:hypothetical protein